MKEKMVEARCPGQGAVFSSRSLLCPLSIYELKSASLPSGVVVRSGALSLG